MRGHGGSRAGFTLAGFVLALSVACLVAALAWPVKARADFEARVEAAVRAAEGTREAMRAHREEEGRWPAPTRPGEVTAELDRHLPPGTDLDGDAWALRIRAWETLEAPAARPPVPIPVNPASDPGPPPENLTPPSPTVAPLAGLSIHSADPALLAALLSSFGPDASFVRDSVWTLILPRDADAGAP